MPACGARRVHPTTAAIAFLVSCTGRPGDSTSRRPWTVSPSHLDLLPTLVDLCGLKLPQPVHFDGVSLRPLLSNPKADWPQRTIVLGTVPNCGGQVRPPLPVYGRNCAVMTDRWRLVEDSELYDMTTDPGQRHDLAAEHPDVVRKLRADYKAYWTDVSGQDKEWRGRPIIGSPAEDETLLCAEDWYPTKGACPWNQGAVAGGRAVFGHWTVRFAEAGAYRVEVRRWPRETDAPISGIPAARPVANAFLDGSPVAERFTAACRRPCPCARVSLTVGSSTQETAVGKGDKAVRFTVNAAAGPADIDARLLDRDGKPLCGACYVYVRRDR